MKRPGGNGGAGSKTAPLVLIWPPHTPAKGTTMSTEYGAGKRGDTIHFRGGNGRLREGRIEGVHAIYYVADGYGGTIHVFDTDVERIDVESAPEDDAQ